MQLFNSPQQNHNFNNASNHRFNSNPLVTVLICNYNYARYLGEAIESALAQTWENLEIIVVDDGSTDKSREILKYYEGKIRIFLKENGGQASAFNMGVAEAKGDIICFLDSDDISHPNRISRVIEKYREGPWGLVCHDLNLIDEQGISLEKTMSNYANVKMVEGQFLDVVINRRYQWVFTPTSGMNLPTYLARKIFPIPSEKWRICADEPLAYSAACLNSVGIISDSLGSYRLHGKNMFADFHRDIDARRIASITHTTRRFFFCKKITSKLNVNLPDPKSNYLWYRRCCLITREKPYRDIFNLLKSNIRHHREIKHNIFSMIFNILRYFISDLLIILGRILIKSSKHNRLKARFDKESFKIEDEQLKYILCDD